MMQRFHTVLAWCLRVLLGIVFLVAAVPKIADPAGFARSISYYRLVPDGAINLMALILPWLELLSGSVLVLGGRLTRPALTLVGLMLIAFIAAIASAMARDLDISCGCFSTGGKAEGMTRWTLYWDIIWLAMTGHAMIWDRGLRAAVAALNPRANRGPPSGS